MPQTAFGKRAAYSLTPNRCMLRLCNQKNKGGFFPLLQTGLGIEYTTKKNRTFAFVFLANNGFINTETIKITNANAVTTYTLKSTYYAVEFRFKLF